TTNHPPPHHSQLFPFLNNPPFPRVLPFPVFQTRSGPSGSASRRARLRRAAARRDPTAPPAIHPHLVPPAGTLPTTSPYPHAGASRATAPSATAPAEPQIGPLD